MAIVAIGPILFFVFVFMLGAPTTLLLAMPVLVAFFGGWALHNDTAYDSTALWLHISSGTSGRHDRLGRLAAFLIWTLPLVTILVIAACAISGQWNQLPAVMGASLGVLGGGLGISLIASALLVYPVQPPGTSPFSSTGMGSVGVTFLAQSVTGAVTLLVTAPSVILAVLALTVSPIWGVGAIAVGGGTALAGLVIGVRSGGSILDHGAAKHLQTISGWSGH